MGRLRATAAAMAATAIASWALASVACTPARDHGAASARPAAPAPAPAAAPAASAAGSAPAPPDAATATATADAAADADAGVPSCVDDGAPYGADELRARVAYLASPALDGRAPGTDGDRAARAHIVQRFRCLGLLPGGAGGSYEQPFDRTANVIGLVRGRDPNVGGEIILVGAHHDHLGGGYLGANDNASGVAALLAVAQAVRRAAPPRRTIAFVAFGAEEAGLLGSAHFVAHPPGDVPLGRVVQMINLDMVGSHASTGSVAAFGTFRHLAARALLDELAPSYPALRISRGGHSVRGDHLGFCRQGIPYVFFWTPDRRCYHETCDTAERLDYPRLAELASLAGALVHRLADAATDLAAAKARSGCGAR